MRRLAGWIGLLSLSGLALLTTSINLRATQRNYDLGCALREQNDLADLISFRRNRCRDWTGALELDQVRRRLELDEETFYSEPLPLPPPVRDRQPLAMGVP